MSALEKYFKLEINKKITENKLKRHSQRFIAKTEENELLKQVNSLYVKGNSLQCFSMLERAVSLVPNDYKPYYLLALIHEENGRYEKASIAFLAAAILKRNDTAMWKKVLEMSRKITNTHNEILALSKINKNEPSVDLVKRKMEIYKQLKKKFSVIACQIELFSYYGINLKIFDKFEKAKHVNSLKKICSALYKCIKHNKEARSEYFMRKTAYTLYKTSDWKRILCLLDNFYYKDTDFAHPDIRILYLLAFHHSDQYRLDSLLSITDLSNDSSIWLNIEHMNYVYDLCILLREKNLTTDALLLVRRLLMYRKTCKNIIFAADFYANIKNYQMSISLYNEAIELDPVNPDIKTKLYAMYVELGLEEKVKELETYKKVSDYIKDEGYLSKSLFRYSTEKCKEMRAAYENLCKIKDYEQFINHSASLLDDFFQNPFVIIKNPHFKSFTNKHEKPLLPEAQALIVADPNMKKSELTDTLIRLSSLHGLDICEWFFVAKNVILSHMALNRFENAMRLALECSNAHIFKSDSSLLIQFHLLGIRLCLMSNDFSTLLIYIREMTNIYGNSSYYLFYFLLTFFPDFYLNSEFGVIQKNIHKILKRSGNSEVCEKTNITSIPRFLALSSFLPRFLHTDSVDFILANISSNTPNEATIKAVIAMTHTKSRTLVDKKKYAKLGFNILKTIKEDDFVKLYNLAKAYHFFGYYTHAETLYYKVIENGPIELRKMSIFNLSLIFRTNKSANVMRSLLSKYYK